MIEPGSRSVLDTPPSRGMTIACLHRSYVGWVERSETHHLPRWPGGIDGYRCAPPILRQRRRKHSATGPAPRNLTATFQPARDPNGLRNVQLCCLFLRISARTGL